MTDWTTARTWASEVLTSTLLNTHLRDNLNHLYENKPYTLIPGLEGHGSIAALGGAGTNEEYGTTTTGLSWSPSDPTTVDSHTTIPSHLYISGQADTTERLGTKSWSPGAGVFDARACALIGSDASAASVSSSVGLHIGDSGNANRLLLLLQYTYNTGVSGVQAWTYASATYTARSSVIAVPGGVPIYLRIYRDGSNNNSFYWSANGRIWNFIVTQALTLTVDNIGYRVAGNATAGFNAAVDWLRTSV